MSGLENVVRKEEVDGKNERAKGRKTLTIQGSADIITKLYVQVYFGEINAQTVTEKYTFL